MADNEENTVKESHKWFFHVFYNCFQIWQPAMPRLLYKVTTGVNKIQKNFLFQLAEKLSSNHDEQNTSFNSVSNYTH